MSKKTALFDRLREHFGGDPARLPVIGQDMDLYERPNMHLAMQELFPDGQAELLGIVEFDYDVSLGLHLDDAITELLIVGGNLTKSLLGAAGAEAQSTDD